MYLRKMDFDENVVPYLDVEAMAKRVWSSILLKW